MIFVGASFSMKNSKNICMLNVVDELKMTCCLKSTADVVFLFVELNSLLGKLILISMADFRSHFSRASHLYRTKFLSTVCFPPSRLYPAIRER
jgi:hypothetical protein